jgi:hypothetical protein
MVRRFGRTTTAEREMFMHPDTGDGDLLTIH